MFGRRRREAPLLPDPLDQQGFGLSCEGTSAPSSRLKPGQVTSTSNPEAGALPRGIGAAAAESGLTGIRFSISTLSRGIPALSVIILITWLTRLPRPARPGRLHLGRPGPPGLLRLPGSCR